MADSVHFHFHLGDNLLYVEADVLDPERRMIAPDLNKPGEPDESPEIEITGCFIKPKSASTWRNTAMMTFPFDIEGLYIAQGTPHVRYTPLIQIIEEHAIEQYEDTSYYKSGEWKDQS